MNSLACCYLFKDKDKEKANVPRASCWGTVGVVSCGVNRDWIMKDFIGFHSE